MLKKYIFKRNEWIDMIVNKQIIISGNIRILKIQKSKSIKFSPLYITAIWPRWKDRSWAMLWIIFLWEKVPYVYKLWNKRQIVLPKGPYTTFLTKPKGSTISSSYSFFLTAFVKLWLPCNFLPLSETRRAFC